MFNLKSTCKSTLAITTILLSTLSIFAIPNSPKVQAGAGNVLNLITNSKTSTDGTNWTNQQVSNNGNYQLWNCGSQAVVGQEGKMAPNLGISDFGDGISIKNKSQITSSQRDCENYNSKSSGQPVFAYQYSFEYKFAADKKASESARYRVHTSQDGDYDSVFYTFTYYNYWNPQKNAWNGWENPNFSNELGGWLAYGIKTEMGVPNVASLPSLGGGSASSQNQTGEIYPFNGNLTFSGYTNTGADLYSCGASCSYFEISRELLKNFDQKTFKQGDLIKVEGKITGSEKGIKFNKFVEVARFLKVGENSPQGQTGEIIELNNEELTYSDYGKASYNFTKTNNGQMQIFNMNRYGDNYFGPDAWQIQGMSNFQLNSKVKISGKAKKISNQSYVFTDITKMEKVGQSSSQNNSQPTSDDLAKAFNNDGYCYETHPNETSVPINSKVSCDFTIANQNLVADFIRNGGEIRAEIVSASNAGRSETCFFNQATSNFLKCSNTPTGSREKNATALNPSDIALFFSNESQDHGYINGKVQIDYGGSSSTSQNTDNFNVSARLDFSKTTGKTSIIVSSDLWKYYQTNDPALGETIAINLYVPADLNLSNTKMGNYGRICENFKDYTTGGIDKVYNCVAKKAVFYSGSLKFDIDKLPNNYDSNKPETHPKVKIEIKSNDPRDTNLSNNTKIITVGPL